MESSEEQLEDPQRLACLESPSLWENQESCFHNIYPNHASQSTEPPETQAAAL